jgi:CRP-like cAMP-binding protein
MDQLASTRSKGNGNGNGHDPRQLEGLLSRLPLFREVDRSQLAGIALLTISRRLRRGTALCRRGEHLTGVIAIGYGVMKLALRRPAGMEKVIRFLNANETFGECAALLNRPCPVDVVALEDSLVAEIPAAPLLRLMERDLRFANNFARAAAERFFGLLAEHGSSLQQTALQRLVAYMVSLAEQSGTPGTWITRLPASKTAVAARLGVTKETLSRLLRELTLQGLISVSQREIELRDMPALMQVVR